MSLQIIIIAVLSVGANWALVQSVFNIIMFMNFCFATAVLFPSLRPKLLHTSTTCGLPNRVSLLVNYKSTQGLSREIFGSVPAMRVQWTPQCICNFFDMPVMLVARMHSFVSGSDRSVRWCSSRPLDGCSLRRRGEICLSASKLDRHLLSGTFKNVLHLRGGGGEALRYKPEGRGFDSRWCHWNFYWHNPSGRTVALGSTQPLTEMSTGNISWGVKAAGAYDWQSYHLHVLIFSKSENLNLLEPSGPVQACNGIALPLHVSVLTNNRRINCQVIQEIPRNRVIF